MKGANHSIVAALAVLTLCSVLQAQPTDPARVASLLDSVERVAVGPVDVRTAVSEDAERDQQGGPYRFAVRCNVEIDVQSRGTWERLSGNVGVCRLRVASPGAVSLSLGFTSYHMPPGASVLLYSTDGTQVLGPYTDQENTSYRQLWTPLIYADELVIELTVPSRSGQKTELVLGVVNHGYRDIRQAEAVATSFEKELGDSGSCNSNVASALGDAYRNQIRSVARFYATRADGQVLGSGALINNTKGDGKPYFLTAFHVLDEWNDGYLEDPNAVAQTMVFYWNFQALKDDTRYEYASADVPKTIPDLATIRSSLVLAQAGTITDLNVKLNISHNWVEDLDVFLIAPDGTRVELFTDVGNCFLCSLLGLPTSNFENMYLDNEAGESIGLGSAPFDWSYRPEGNLAALYGKSIAGTWTLEITDDAWLVSGTLNSWSLIVNAPERQTQTGAVFQAACQSTDFCLVELAQKPPASVNVYYAGWDRSSTVPSMGVAIHHPEGDLKKISIEYDPLSVSSYLDLSTDMAQAVAPFIGSYRPEGRLASLYGKSIAGTWKLEVTDDSWLISGTLNSWSLDVLETNSSAYTHYASSDVPKTIPDVSTMVSTLTISQTGTIADLNVRLDILHSWVADLDVFLIAPDGTRVELFTDVGGSGENFMGTILDDEASDKTHLKVASWDVGTTEAGSSGCPLFDANKRIVGQLHGGNSSCGNGKPDWFGRFHMSWTGEGTSGTRLSDWLDPLHTGVLFLDGMNPGSTGNP